MPTNYNKTGKGVAKKALGKTTDAAGKASVGKRRPAAKALPKQAAKRATAARKTGTPPRPTTGPMSDRMRGAYAKGGKATKMAKQEAKQAAKMSYVGQGKQNPKAKAAKKVVKGRK